MKYALHVVFFLLAIPAVVLSLMVRQQPGLPFDMQIAGALRGIASPAFAALMAGVSLPGERPVAEVLVLLGAAALAIGRQRAKALLFILATGSALPVTTLIKFAVARSRPTPGHVDGFGIFQTEGPYGFPSGHTVFYTVFFGILCYLAWKYLSGYLRWAAVTACVALIVLVGPSRVYLGAHWPSDIIGGYLVGGAWLVVLVSGYRWLSTRWDP